MLIPKLLTAFKIFAVFPVCSKAGRCNITLALNPVPTFVGHAVKYPYFLFIAYPKVSFIFSSNSIAKFNVFSKSSPQLNTCILKWSSSPIIIQMLSSSFINMLPVSFLFKANSGLIRFFSTKLIFVISSISFSLKNLSPYPIPYRLSFILFSNASLSCFVFRLKGNPAIFLANLIRVLFATSLFSLLCKYQFMFCFTTFLLSMQRVLIRTASNCTLTCSFCTI